MPPMLTAPASSASSMIRPTCSGESLTPGINGAIRMPHGMPARLSSATASRRFRGCGVWGSVERQAFSSRVGTDRLARISGTCFISSMSRSSSGDLVRTDAGVPLSASASQMPGMSR